MNSLATKPRIVLTGGPAAGKTAIAEVIRRQLTDEIAVLPESATILFRGGFPRPSNNEGVRLLQKAIFSVQRQLEEIFAITHPDVPHVLDRGSLDGAAYWPGGLKRFLGAMGTTLDSEYRRYNVVIFLESCAYDKQTYPEDNPVRTETPAGARKIDSKLRSVWQDHPKFTVIEHQSRFYEKVAAVLIAIERALK